MGDQVPDSPEREVLVRLTPGTALRLKHLTPREAEVALLAARGLCVYAIAGRLQAARSPVPPVHL